MMTNDNIGSIYDLLDDPDFKLWKHTRDRCIELGFGDKESSIMADCEVPVWKDKRTIVYCRYI